MCGYCKGTELTPHGQARTCPKRIRDEAAQRAQQPQQPQPVIPDAIPAAGNARPAIAAPEVKEDDDEDEDADIVDISRLPAAGAHLPGHPIRNLDNEGENSDDDDEKEDDNGIDVAWLSGLQWSEVADVPAFNDANGASRHIDEWKHDIDFQTHDGAPPGARNVDDVKTPLDIFVKVFAQENIDLLIKETNAYAKSTKMKSWKVLTQKELFGFFAVSILFALEKPHGRRRAWELTRKGRATIRLRMSRNQYEAILSCLHAVNTATFTDAQKKAKGAEDAFWQLRPWLDNLSASFRKHYVPAQNADVDEQAIMFRGRHRARQYNPHKPAKFHFKNYALNDALTGFQCNFFFYQGKDAKKDADYDGISATEYPVRRLVDEMGDTMKDTGHILGTDNWYTSIPMMYWLRDHGLHSVGTIKANRKGVPKGKLFKGAPTARNPRGAMRVLHATHRGVKAVLTSWQDKKPVNFLSSFDGLVGNCNRNVSVGGQFQESTIDCPTVRKVYHDTMGGTDKMDQLCSTYAFTNIKTRRWPHRIFFFMFGVALVNSFVIAKEKLQNCPKTYLDFLEAIVDELSPLQSLPPDQPEPLFEDIAQEEEEDRLLGTHTPEIRTHSSMRCRCCLAVDGSKRQRNNKKEMPRVTSWCKECNAALCMREGSTCWTKWHTQNVLR